MTNDILLRTKSRSTLKLRVSVRRTMKGSKGIKGGGEGEGLDLAEAWRNCNAYNIWYKRGPSTKSGITVTSVQSISSPLSHLFLTVKKSYLTISFKNQGLRLNFAERNKLSICFWSRKYFWEPVNCLRSLKTFHSSLVSLNPRYAIIKFCCAAY